MKGISRRDFLRGTALTIAATGMTASATGAAFASENTSGSATSSASAAASSAAGSSVSGNSASGSTTSSAFIAGTYTASAPGKNGDVTVSAVFGDSRIEVVEVVSHTETSGISDRALQTLPQRIVDAQSTEIDAVSGATLSSLAVINAARDCAEQAQAADALSATIPEAPASERSIEADVVVIGAGGAGLVAAREALEQGKRVVVVDKQDDAGGSTRLNGAMFLAPANDDELGSTSALSADELVQLYSAYVGENPYYDETMVTDFVGSMEDNLEYLDGHAYHPVRYLYPGWLPLDPSDANAEAIHVIITEPKLLVTPSSDATWSEEDDGGWPDGIGSKFTIPMTEGVRELGGTVLLGTTASSIVMTDGKVAGIEALGDNNVSYHISAPAVILASGGFGGNADLREKYWGSADYLYGGTYANDGSGIAMAEKAGAFVDYIYTEGSTDYPLYDSVGGVLIDSDACVLDADGNPVPGLFAAGEIADLRFLGEVYPICGSFDQWSVYTGRKAGASAAAMA